MKEKTIVLGDTHGRNTWETIVKEPHDRVIFIGDYFDSFDIPYENQIRNFLDICKFKENHDKEVIMLIGNHDYHYMGHVDEQYSGYQTKYAYVIRHALELNKDLLQMSYILDKILFTHAGVSKTWLKNNNIKVEEINDLYKHKPSAFRFSGRSWTGDDVTQSPVWIRPESLLYDKVYGYTQVVGHTRQRFINNQKNVWFIDVLEESNSYLCIEDNKIRYVS